jgi:hypothetical protein
MVKACIIDKCTEEVLDLYDFIHREGDHPRPIRIILLGPGNLGVDDEPITKEKITKDITKIKSTVFQLYLENISKSLDYDIRTQKTLINL